MITIALPPLLWKFEFIKCLFYYRLTAENEQRVLAFGPRDKTELDAEYDCDVDDYHPVQPLVHDHGVSFVCLSSPLTKIDQHVIQVGENWREILLKIVFLSRNMTLTYFLATQMKRKIKTVS